MPVGRCRLCHREDAELQDSHFIPAAFYKLLKTPGEKDSNPVVMNPKVQFATSKQVTGHLLCKSCEDLFNKNGEAWLLGNCWRSDTEFPLREVLKAATAVEASTEFAAFAGRSIEGVDVDKLVYFAASVFWRATLIGWRSVGGHVPTQLYYGAHGTGLRPFLLGEAGFPENVVLRTSVIASTDPVPHRAVTFPYRKTGDSRFHQYRFVIPGITFELLVGKGIPQEVRELCTARSQRGLIFSSPKMDEINIADAIRLFSKGRAVGKLAKG